MPKPLYRQDKQLVKRLLAGDERAFEAFFESHYPALYRFALRRLGGDGESAADVAQGALVKAIGKLSTYRGEAALTSWLFTFCRHEISAHLRRQGRMPEQLAWLDDVPEVQAVLESLASPVADQPEARLRHKELVGWVQMTLDYLPPHYGQVLEWKYMQEMSVKEIACRLELAPKAAESLLTRARQAFREGFAALREEGRRADPGRWAFARAASTSRAGGSRS